MGPLKFSRVAASAPTMSDRVLRSANPTTRLLRAALREEGGNVNDQALVYNIKNYLHVNGYNSNSRGGRHQQARTSITRRTMLQEQIQAIITSPHVLTFQRDNGGRISCSPVITSATIAEFRSVFVYNLKKISDPALSIITSPNGLVCTVYIWCRKVLLEVLQLLPEHLERYCRVAYPPEDPQPLSTVHCNFDDAVIITFKTREYHEFGPLHKVPASEECSCGHRSHNDRQSARKNQQQAETPPPPTAEPAPSLPQPSPAPTLPPSTQSIPAQTNTTCRVTTDSPFHTPVPTNPIPREGSVLSKGYCAHSTCTDDHIRRSQAGEYDESYQGQTAVLYDAYGNQWLCLDCYNTHRIIHDGTHPHHTRSHLAPLV